MNALLDWMFQLQRFLQAGGEVLWVIAALAIVLFALVLERIWYYRAGLPEDARVMQQLWREHRLASDWHTHHIRESLVSCFAMKVRARLPWIQALVMIAPLLGVLGTVTGMVSVFTAMSLVQDEARFLSEGISRATLPTMAGMVISIVGLFAKNALEQSAQRYCKQLEESLTIDRLEEVSQDLSGAVYA